MIPVYGFVEGDVLGLLLLTYPNETVATLCSKLLQAARTRVWSQNSFALHYKGQVLDPSTTVDLLKLKPLDRLDLRLVRQP